MLRMAVVEGLILQNPCWTSAMDIAVKKDDY